MEELKTVFLDGRQMQTRQAAHDHLAKQLELPAYYGRNLDALYDLLTDRVGPTGLVVKNQDVLLTALGKYGAALCKTLEDAARNNPWLEVEFAAAEGDKSTKPIYHALQDPAYQKPYIDVEESRVRTLPGGQSIEYTYVHGGFEDTGVKFAFHFPKKEQYRGRFFQYLSPFPGPDEEIGSVSHTGADDRIAFALVHGAYFVESNMGSASAFGARSDETVTWKSSAAVAEYSRKKAVQLYGCQRPVGIVYGGSGGGYKTMACIENTDAWEGAVPYVIGSPASLPNTITMHAKGQRVLRKAFGKILDNIDAGGCGDPYDGLSADEAAMLKELTDMGFPPLAWYLEAGGQIDPGSLPVLIPIVRMRDPEYFSDFWSLPGYEGADPSSTAVCDRLMFRTTVKQVHLPEGQSDGEETEGRNSVDDAWKKMLADGQGAWLEPESLPGADKTYFDGTNITFVTGKAAGKVLALGNILRGEQGGLLTIGSTYGADDPVQVLSQVRPGDEILLDNSDYIAVQSYYRHQTPADPSFHAWDQFRDERGEPLLPQRREQMSYTFTGTGTVQDGNIQGKVILVQALTDESTCPWCGDWYRNKVIESKGGEADFRIYYMQRCMHGDTGIMENTMVVNYMGALYQALLDMAVWLQTGKEPLPSTAYRRVGGQIEVEADAARRNGMQAGILLTANGEKCARVKVGEPVILRVEATVPAGAGQVTGTAFDFSNSWAIPTVNPFPVKVPYILTEKGAAAELTQVFDQPGTYFAAARVTSQREGNADDPFTQVKNLDRVRVIVE